MQIEIPIFPLPNVVWFPHTYLPLHVFELRYRQMVEDCLCGDRRMAVVRLKEGWEKDYYGRPPVHRIAAAGKIIRANRVPDGRFHILLLGEERIAIAGEIPKDRLYRVARAWVLSDHRSEGTTLNRVVDELKRAAGRFLLELNRPPIHLFHVLGSGAKAGVIVDRMASALVSDPDQRQRLLDTLELRERAGLLLEYLERLRNQGRQSADPYARRAQMN
ncbi:MAG: LON peptidase substrate-binding domain-containing protein [Candidatus Methylomirabilales bacterium]